MFQKYDKDGSGTIDMEEFTLTIRDFLCEMIIPIDDSQIMLIESISRNISEELISAMDDDNSGDISFAEFRTAIQTVYKKMVEIEKTVKQTNNLYSAHSALVKDPAGNPFGSTMSPTSVKTGFLKF